MRTAIVCYVAYSIYPVSAPTPIALIIIVVVATSILHDIIDFLGDVKYFLGRDE